MTLDDIIKIFFSLLVGGLIGLEREYRSKPAGLRTLILICIGSTLFTIISIKLGGPNNPDRIASYIVAGIGFLGAGAIFRDGSMVRGLTSAATIWLTAGLGMAIGNGQILFSVFILLVVYATLEFLRRFEAIIDGIHTISYFKVSLRADLSLVNEIENEFRTICPRMKRVNVSREGDVLSILYRVEGGRIKFDALRNFLTSNKEIIGFES